MKLNIGCGGKLDGDVNIDLREGYGEVRADARWLPFRDKAFEDVLLSDVVEHVTSKDALLVIQEAFRVSCREIVFRLPSLEGIMDRYKKGEKAEKISWWLFGGQTYAENFHCAVYDAASFKRLLGREAKVKYEGTNMVITVRRKDDCRKG